MRMMKIGLWLGVFMLASAGMAIAQSTMGTIRGHVQDTQGLSLPGVTVSVASPNLQGIRVGVTSENGDYIVTLLPPGRYRVTFDLSGFQTVERELSLAPTQVLPIDVTFSPASVRETVNVVGTASNILGRTAQAATSFPQPLIASLPNNRDLSSVLLLAPSLHQTGANGGYSISGAVSFENLFMVNGVSVVENLRGQPHDLYVEDAIQETSIATSGISAEFGRFTGGVVNVVTKSGGNLFSGSLRDTLQNDKWRAHTPFEQRTIAADPARRDTRLDKTVPTYEHTLGGPLLKDRLWFFTSGRMQKEETARTLLGTSIPYVFGEDSKRFEVSATYSPNPRYRLQGILIDSTATRSNDSFAGTGMDVNSLYDGERLMNLFTVNYSGVLTSSFFLEGRYSARNETLKNIGSKTTDRITGTLLLDRSNRRYWSPTFCGVCDPEERDGENFFFKGSYFLSTKRFGSHAMVMGYDGYDDKRFANNHQSGSDFRIFGTNAIIRGTGASAVIYPQFLPDGQTFVVWQPIIVGSEGSHFRTHSLFYNDNWRMSNRVTANLGLRYDRNHGANSVGDIVSRDSALSPRFGVVFDPVGDQKWSVTGSVAKYVAGIANTVADSSSPGGNADLYGFTYRGPAINADPNGTLLSSSDALAQVFAWYDANGAASLPLAVPPSVRGVTPQIQQSLTSPNAWEYSAGVSRQLGDRLSVRVDGTYRTYHDFYVQRTDLSTGRVTDNRTGDVPLAVRGRVYDLTVIENTDRLKRRYAGLTLQGQYRGGVGLNVGGNYTLSRLWGNAEGENVNAGPISSDILQFPEYKATAWNAPQGDLSADQRHRMRAWVTYVVPKFPSLSLGLLEVLESGVPYGAVGTVNAPAVVANPGYLTPPAAANITYFYTARDAFRTEGQRRTDLAVNYTKRPWNALRLEVFGQVQILNLFDQYQLCGCGASTVFQTGGAVIASRLDQTVRTPVTTAASYQAFNPFTTTPQRGTNWDLGPTFGTGTSRFSYTTPRTLRLSFGVRF